MRAAIYREYGGPDVLELAELPDPKVHVDSVLVRVVAAAVNPADLGNQAGSTAGTVETYFPVIPGWDIAGVVERVGLGAGDLAPGDEVVGYLRGEVQRQHGGYAELVSADVRTLAPKPRSLSWEQAAALPLAGLTAYRAVAHVLDVRRGETLLVHGASGAVGQLAAQLAVVRGATVIGTASVRNHDYLRSIQVIPVEYGDGLVEHVRAVAPGGVDAVFDAAGHGALSSTSAVGRPSARVASTTDFSDPGVRPVFARYDQSEFRTLARLADEGSVVPRVGAVYPLDRAADAQRAVAGGAVSGKVVLRIAAGTRSSENAGLRGRPGGEQAQGVLGR
ncbi:NADPH:quinone reductase [Asanoa hainanensis]|uniref:NADPH:quinone reductase n=1 Tax=Asanoa hainanensis TaxID=560556 RepID=A0A239PBD6_9ACTN|nr:NADP-dependent oxidoreductase [Asanoa hainanensis]SNT63898.1 NADPH:quinone reductase [Asanoa hainanensis]